MLILISRERYVGTMYVHTKKNATYTLEYYLEIKAKQPLTSEHYNLYHHCIGNV